MIRTDNKIAKYQMMCGTTRRALGTKASKETRVKCHTVRAVPVLIYGSEIWWNVRDKDETRTESAEMKFFRSVNGCTIPKQIRQELQIKGNTNRTGYIQTEWDRMIMQIY
jgi:hypothetical protein